MPDFWGKYRGMVVDNVDPLTLGRLQVMVPRVLGDVLGAWAMPCVPYAGPDVGFCMAPPIGAAIWVEFEGGDPDYPVWTGCYWREGERPVTAELPTTRTILTACGILQFDDLPGEGGFTLSVGDPAVAMPVSIVAGSTGLTIRMAEVSIVLNETGVTIAADPALLSVQVDGVTLAHGGAMIAAIEPEVSINEGALSIL